jgi:SAM-dependent methyltransferase
VPGLDPTACLVLSVRMEGSDATGGGSRPRYERIGHRYARTRREDPRVAKQIHDALGSASPVVNVGAGAGSYEPRDRHVIAIEPSDVMAAQRPAELAPALRASAGDLPLRNQSVDAAMAILTIHHWDSEQERGVRELRRVARGPVVILTYDSPISNQMWLTADYLPEVANLDRQIFPSLDTLAGWLGGHTVVEAVAVSRDTPDWTFGSFWAHPERVLDSNARHATSGFARLDPQVVQRVARAIKDDLQTGRWEQRYGHLRQLQALDVGLRLLVNNPD